MGCHTRETGLFKTQVRGLDGLVRLTEDSSEESTTVIVVIERSGWETILFDDLAVGVF